MNISRFNLNPEWQISIISHAGCYYIDFSPSTSLASVFHRRRLSSQDFNISQKLTFVTRRIVVSSNGEVGRCRYMQLWEYCKVAVCQEKKPSREGSTSQHPHLRHQLFGGCKEFEGENRECPFGGVEGWSSGITVSSKAIPWWYS